MKKNLLIITLLAAFYQTTYAMNGTNATSNINVSQNNYDQYFQDLAQEVDNQDDDGVDQEENTEEFVIPASVLEENSQPSTLSADSKERLADPTTIAYLQELYRNAQVCPWDASIKNLPGGNARDKYSECVTQGLERLALTYAQNLKNNPDLMEDRFYTTMQTLQTTGFAPSPDQFRRLEKIVFDVIKAKYRAALERKELKAMREQEVQNIQLLLDQLHQNYLQMLFPQLEQELD